MCCRKLLYFGLTAALVYQVFYNFMGARELGGSYLSLSHLLYSVGSLIPAVLLGIHACKLVCSNDDEKKLHMARSRTYKRICGFYLTIIAAMLLFRVFMHFQWIHQLAPEHIVSYERSRKWLLYYWGILQYGLSFVLTFSYMRTAHKIKKNAKSAQESANKVLRASFEVPLHQDPEYKPTVMV